MVERKMLKNIEINNFGSYKNFTGLVEKNYLQKKMYNQYPSEREEKNRN